MSSPSATTALLPTRRSSGSARRGDMALAPECYAEDFVDHVGGVEYRGLDGVRRSTAVYRALFDNLTIEVLDQVAEGDRVASRWALTGSNRGRAVRLTGITISLLRDGRLVEDWSRSTAWTLCGRSVRAHRCALLRSAARHACCAGRIFPELTVAASAPPRLPGGDGADPSRRTSLPCGGCPRTPSARRCRRARPASMLV